MDKTFAEIVDEVRELTFEEKEELLDVLKSSLLEERREQILANGKSAREAYAKGELTEYSDVDELMEALHG